MICPSQSPWCNAVVLVCKKDGGLCFCINFCKLNVRTRKDSYLLPWILEVIKRVGGAGYFFLLVFKAGFWQITMDEASKQYTPFTVGNMGFFECECMLLGCVMPWPHSKDLLQICLGELNLTYCLIYLDDAIIFSKMEEEHLHHLHIVFEHFREHNLKLKPTKSEFFKNKNQLLGSQCLQGRCVTQQGEPKSCGQIHSTTDLHQDPSLFWAWLDITDGL